MFVTPSWGKIESVDAQFEGRVLVSWETEHLPSPLKFIPIPPATRTLRCPRCNSEDFSLCPRGTTPQTYQFECDECDTTFSRRELREGGPARFYSEGQPRPVAVKCPACCSKSLTLDKGSGQPLGFQLVCGRCDWRARVPLPDYLSVRMWEQ